MFQVNEMIVYGKHGICKIVAKGKIDMPMIDKNKEYEYSERAEAVQEMAKAFKNAGLNITKKIKLERT